MIIKGHKLEIEKSTEKKRLERTHTGRCVCGWEEGCNTLSEVRKEYRLHLKREKNKKYTNFVNEIQNNLHGNCYIAIMHNDEGYDIEVESNEGSIAGNYATETSDLVVARKVADEIEKEISDRGIEVFKTRESWEEFLTKDLNN